MDQAQWIPAVNKALQDGPMRFTYKALHITYLLKDTGDMSGKIKYHSYTLRVERGATMLLDSSGYTQLEQILVEHPLHLFESERTLKVEESQEPLG